MEVAAVIVTYNRKKDLGICINAVLSQSYHPERIYVIDNNSTDGTDEYIKKWAGDNRIIYIRLSENIGGAGGFNYGIKNAYEDGADYIWIMDDDGAPDIDCLRNLLSHIDCGEYLAPLVVSTEDRCSLSFPGDQPKTLIEIKKKYPEGIIFDYASPFNGIILSRKLVDIVGLPKSEFFIWGDEREFTLRAAKYGFKPTTIINAIHYHPKDRMLLDYDIKGRKSIVYVGSELRRYCYYRNHIYNLKKYSKSRFKSIGSFIFYNLLYCATKGKPKLKSVLLLLRGVYHGLVNDFNHHKEYINR